MGVSASRGLGRFWALLILLTLMSMLGCRSRTGSVSGKVYLDDKVLKGGDVTFITEVAGKPSSSTSIQPDGSYKIDDAPTGPVTICVQTESLNPANFKGRMYSAPPGSGMSPPGFKSDNKRDTADRYTKIPDKYGDPEKSDLKYQVKSGSQNYDIKLTSGASGGAGK